MSACIVPTISITQVAAALAVSPHHFRRCFVHGDRVPSQQLLENYRCLRHNLAIRFGDDAVARLPKIDTAEQARKEAGDAAA